jgi:hypothetical protein
VQIVCCFQGAVERAARADLAEHDAIALRAENQALKAHVAHLEIYVARLDREIRISTGELPRCSVDNVRWSSSRSRRPEICGPAPAWPVISEARRRAPIGMLTTDGVVAP